MLRMGSLNSGITTIGGKRSKGPWGLAGLLLLPKPWEHQHPPLSRAGIPSPGAACEGQEVGSLWNRGLVANKHQGAPSWLFRGFLG